MDGEASRFGAPEDDSDAAARHPDILEARRQLAEVIERLHMAREVCVAEDETEPDSPQRPG